MPPQPQTSQSLTLNKIEDGECYPYKLAVGTC